MKEECNIQDSPYDSIIDQFLSGAVSKKDAEKFIIENRKFEKQINEQRELDFLDSTLTYHPTQTILKYYSNEKSLYIQKVTSGVQNQKGFSRLLSQLEGIAEQSEIQHLSLDVRSKNKDAIKKYTHKGFYETGRTDKLNKEGALVSMQKDLVF